MIKNKRSGDPTQPLRNTNEPTIVRDEKNQQSTVFFMDHAETREFSIVDYFFAVPAFQFFCQ